MNIQIFSSLMQPCCYHPDTISHEVTIKYFYLLMPIGTVLKYLHDFCKNKGKKQVVVAMGIFAKV